MLVAMQQQLAGKVGNAGNNAFKLRKLFKMYDRDGTGQVRPTTSVGWQSTQFPRFFIQRSFRGMQYQQKSSTMCSV